MRASIASIASITILAAVVIATPVEWRREPKLLKDINVIQRYWGQISPYFDNDEDFFGVDHVGLPDGCQVEQVHTLQRHANRFPTSYFDDGPIAELFAQKVKNQTSTRNGSFTGDLTFLNTYTYIMQHTGLLTGLGAATEFQSGVQFWNRYGRTLYNASVAQLAYNATANNGSARAKPVLRTTSQARIENSQVNWALGFFGPSWSPTPDAKLTNWTDAFELVVIPEGGTENNTLASYDSCFNDLEDEVAYVGDNNAFIYIPKYLKAATARLQKSVPEGFTLTTNDTFAMQITCAYEMTYIGMSDFCGLFTKSEWEGFENVLDIEYYYDYAWGNPTGRAQGIGYLQELLARLQSQYITTSNTSVNSTLTNNSDTFPLHQPFYADFSHDDIIVSALNAMSLDYFREPPSLTQFPPDPDRAFILSHLTPFGGRLITEVIGCSSATPSPIKHHRTSYTPNQYGYDAKNANHKFVRMRLNHGILPLESIRGGECEGRVDGLCELGKFVSSQKEAETLANYQYACFGNWTLSNAGSGKDLDGTIFK